jgi:hypothetical protein
MITYMKPTQLLLRVPFVGCASDGQVGPLKAPTRHSKVAAIREKDAERLAFYQAEEGIGVLAPRGWHCFSTYGSSGSSLFVSPDPIDGKWSFSDGWTGFTGPIIQVSISDGDTSGRFKVAEIAARVFPGYRKYVQRVIAEGIRPASDFPFGPYPNDKLIYRGRSIVEFETPANTEGLGTCLMLKSNSSPIAGVAILSGEETSLFQLSARLPDEDRDLLQVIVRQLKREVVKAEGQ